MKETNTAVGYAVVYHGLAEIARKYGYALALHGSMLTDLDVIAIPWTDEAVDEFTLLKALKNHLGLCGTLSEDYENKKVLGMETKLHNRMAWKILIGHGCSVDLSIMPRA